MGVLDCILGKKFSYFIDFLGNLSYTGDLLQKNGQNMILIQPTYDNFVKFDKTVLQSRTLSDGAKVLYGYFAGLRHGTKYTDEKTCEDLGIGTTTLYRRKGELKKQDLIYTQQLAPKTFVLFVGNTKMRASKVMDRWNHANQERKINQ